MTVASGPSPSSGAAGPAGPVVFVILDAARADYASPESMPFLHGLSRRALSGSLESPPGFAQRTVMFTGLNPDRSGNFSAFTFDPEASPFRWIRALGPAGRLVQPWKIMFPARWAISRVTRLATRTYHADPAWIPPRYLPFFRPCEDMRPIHEPGALPATSLFDLCREHGIPYRYLAHPVSGDDDEVCTTLVRELRAKTPTRLFVAQLSATDELGHRHGPHSAHMRKRVLAAIDDKLASIHAALAANHPDWSLLVVGDHGMAPVRTRFNIAKAIAKSGARPGKDYVLFVNSTLAVLWYLTADGRRRIEDVLPSIPGTVSIDSSDRERLHIPPDRRWGDRMVAAKPGVMFWPDYFHVRDSTIVGMHGYLDKVDEGQGLMVLAQAAGHPPSRTGLHPLVDVFPTLCNLLAVPVPAGQEGISFVGPPAMAVPQQLARRTR